MVVFLIVLALLLVCGIGYFTVGFATYSLRNTPPPTIFDIEEAVAFVSEELPVETKNQLSYDDVEQMLLWHIEYLQVEGVATKENSLTIEDDITISDSDALQYLLQKSDEKQRMYEDEDIALVLESSMKYLVAVGAIQQEKV